jgi:hypothetical protein
VHLNELGNNPISQGGKERIIVGFINIIDKQLNS